jgi:protein-tyrosine phosphatase
VTGSRLLGPLARRHPVRGIEKRRVLAAVAVVAFISPLLAACSSSSSSPTTTSASGTSSSGNSSSVPFTAATVSGSPSSWTVAWTAPGAAGVKVFEGSSPTSTPTPVGSGSGTGTVTVAGAPGVPRAWFRLVPTHGQSLVLADRDLGLTGDPNLRDIGGYRTTSGAWVRMGVVYRSQALDDLTPSDLSIVNGLGITDVYDLRTPDEASGSPDAQLAGATYHLVNVFGTPSPGGNVGTTTASAQSYMTTMNRQFVTGSADREAFKTLLTDVADSTGAQLFNCTAGKDRTGWATAVILTLLGVAPSTVMQDYMLSNTYYFDSAATQNLLKNQSASQTATLTAVLDVSPTYLQSGLDQVTSTYGSMYAYVVKGLGVSPATVTKLREKLLVA